MGLWIEGFRIVKCSAQFIGRMGVLDDGQVFMSHEELKQVAMSTNPLYAFLKQRGIGW